MLRVGFRNVTRPYDLHLKKWLPHLEKFYVWFYMPEQPPWYLSLTSEAWEAQKTKRDDRLREWIALETEGKVELVITPRLS